MILSKNTESENIVVFDDFVLQIIMGQWLGVLPSSSKRGFLLSFYKEPKNVDEFDSNRISKKKMEKIGLEFAKVLKMFGLQDEIYLIKNFDPEKQAFFVIYLIGVKPLLYSIYFIVFLLFLHRL